MFDTILSADPKNRNKQKKKNELKIIKNKQNICLTILSKLNLIHYSFNSLLFLKLIDYSKVFPLYQRLNPLFDWTFNRLLSDRSILARGVTPARRPQPSRAKMLRSLSKRLKKKRIKAIMNQVKLT